MPTRSTVINSYVQTWLLYLFLSQQMNILIVALAGERSRSLPSANSYLLPNPFPIARLHKQLSLACCASASISHRSGADRDHAPTAYALALASGLLGLPLESHRARSAQASFAPLQFLLPVANVLFPDLLLAPVLPCGLRSRCTSAGTPCRPPGARCSCR